MTPAWRTLYEARKGAVEKATKPDATVLAEWWAANKGTWYQSMTGNGWVPVFDGVVECEVGKPRTMRLGGREVEVCLQSYDSADGDNEPSVGMAFGLQDSVLKTEGGLVVDESATPFSIVAAASDSVFSARVLVMPTQTTVHRVRLWLWFLADRRPPEVK